MIVEHGLFDHFSSESQPKYNGDKTAYNKSITGTHEGFFNEIKES